MASTLIARALLLCALFAQQASALRRRPHRIHPAECEGETASFLQNDLPEMSTMLQRVEETFDRGEQEFQEYMQNITHVRVCKSIGDHVEALSTLVVPKLKLAFCYLPKVACSNFKDLMNRLNGFSKKTEGFGHDYLRSSRVGMRFPAKNISKANGWKFAIFTRDPALRYLSAFGSTCVATNDQGHFEHSFECCGPLIRSNRVSATTMVKAFQERAMSDLQRGIVKMDDHWSQQVSILRQCGWKWFAPEKLDFHGTLNGDVNAQVKDMLKMVGKEDADELVDRLFPRVEVAGHRSPIHVPPEEFYNNKTVLEAVKELYADDYDSFPNIGCSFTEPMMKKLTAEEHA
mmetsp:Transcript_18739/g.44028  ORF Transcript_18739/g.44028 Transcript_18739/m.44028 type:complete len:346 (+) Transcript_18739:75-1112(+)